MSPEVHRLVDAIGKELARESMSGKAAEALYKIAENLVEGAAIYGDIVEVRLTAFRPLAAWYARNQRQPVKPGAGRLTGPFEKRPFRRSDLGPAA